MKVFFFISGVCLVNKYKLELYVFWYVVLHRYRHKCEIKNSVYLRVQIWQEQESIPNSQFPVYWKMLLESSNIFSFITNKNI